MSRLIPMSDLVADDLLLDRLAAREPAGSEPVAGLLAALADHADTPLTARAARRRRGRTHRYLGPFAALVVAATGAGVAAAVTVPHHAADQAERARVVKQMESAARSDAPSALLSRLGLPRTTASTDARGLVLARRGDGSIVLAPAAAAATRGAGVVLAALPADSAALGVPPDGVASAGNGHGGNQQGAGADGHGGDHQAGEGRPSGTPATHLTGAAVPGSTPKQPATGGGGSDTHGTVGSTGGTGAGSPTATSGGKAGTRPKTGSTPAVAPTSTPTPTPTVSPTTASDAAAGSTAPLSEALVGPTTAPLAPRRQVPVALPAARTTPSTTAATPALPTGG